MRGMGMWRVLLAITSLDPASVYREGEKICNERWVGKRDKRSEIRCIIMSTLQYILEEPRPP
jgi:hypothetical protein